MWNYLTKYWNEDQTVNLNESFYCGDRAGRPKTEIRKADKNSSDYEFAATIGVKFYTPEIYFLNLNDQIPPLDLKNKQSDCLNDEDMFIKNEEEMCIVVDEIIAERALILSEDLNHFI